MTLRALAISIVAGAPFAACATVSVYEPVTAEVSLTEDQSQLHAAAEAYSESARQKGLASGEASLASLGDILSGKQSDTNAYWRRIGADKGSTAAAAGRIREDLGAIARGLRNLDVMAHGVIEKGDPAGVDVLAFERALIHARQARDSFSDALLQVNKRAEAEYQILLELAPLDNALAAARETADDLAAARSEASEAGGS